MKITAIKPQLKRTDRFSVFIDGSYEFSLSADVLLSSKIATGQDLSPEQLTEYKQLSDQDKLYGQTLRYVAARPHSEWEIRQYLVRKKVSPTLADVILNKLRITNLIDDEAYATMFVHDRRLLRSASTRKLSLELRKKHISSEIIEKVLRDDVTTDASALKELIIRKRRQTKYQDDQKLMQYLARQGFNYGDIKTAFQED